MVEMTGIYLKILINHLQVN